MSTVRGQIVFRDAVGASRSAMPVERRGGHQFHYAIAAGILECEPGTFVEQRMLPISLSKAGAEHTIVIARDGGAPPDHHEQNDLGGILRDFEVEAGGFDALLCVGRAYARRTRFPSPEGRETLAFSALLRSPGSFPELRTMFEFAGKAGARMTLANRGASPDLFPIGSAIAQTFQAPVWGFEGPNRGFTSTLGLAVIDDGNEILRLRGLESRTTEQEKRLLKLKRTIAGNVFEAGDGDPMFARFREEMRSAGLVHPFDSYPTAAEQVEYERAAAGIVRRLIEEDRAPVAAPGP